MSGSSSNQIRLSVVIDGKKATIDASKLGKDINAAITSGLKQGLSGPMDKIREMQETLGRISKTPIFDTKGVTDVVGRLITSLDNVGKRLDVIAAKWRDVGQAAKQAGNEATRATRPANNTQPEGMSRAEWNAHVKQQLEGYFPVGNVRRRDRSGQVQTIRKLRNYTGQEMSLTVDSGGNFESYRVLDRTVDELNRRNAVIARKQVADEKRATAEREKAAKNAQREADQLARKNASDAQSLGKATFAAGQMYGTNQDRLTRVQGILSSGVFPSSGAPVGPETRARLQGIEQRLTERIGREQQQAVERWSQNLRRNSEQLTRATLAQGYGTGTSQQRLSFASQVIGAATPGTPEYVKAQTMQQRLHDRVGREQQTAADRYSRMLRRNSDALTRATVSQGLGTGTTEERLNFGLSALATSTPGTADYRRLATRVDRLRTKYLAEEEQRLTDSLRRQEERSADIRDHNNFIARGAAAQQYIASGGYKRVGSRFAQDDDGTIREVSVDYRDKYGRTLSHDLENQRISGGGPPIPPWYKRILGGDGYFGKGGPLASLGKQIGGAVLDPIGSFQKLFGLIGSIGTAMVKLAGTFYVFKQLGGIIKAVLVDPFSEFIQKIVSATEQYRRFELSIVGVVGDLGNAQKLDERLLYASQNSPNSISDYQDTARQIAFLAPLAPRLALGTVNERAQQVEQYQALVNKFALFDPEQGPRGVNIAFRESIGSGNLRSLRQRLEISPSLLARTIGKNESDIASDPSLFLKAAETYANIYIPDEAVQKMGDLVTKRMDKLRDSVQFALKKVGDAGLYDAIVDRLKEGNSKLLQYIEGGDFAGQAKRISDSLVKIIDNIVKAIAKAIGVLTGQDVSGGVSDMVELATRAIERLGDLSEKLPTMGEKIGNALLSVKSVLDRLIPDRQGGSSGGAVNFNAQKNGLQSYVPGNGRLGRTGRAIAGVFDWIAPGAKDALFTDDIGDEDRTRAIIQNLVRNTGLPEPAIKYEAMKRRVFDPSIIPGDYYKTVTDNVASLDYTKFNGNPLLRGELMKLERFVSNLPPDTRFNDVALLRAVEGSGILARIRELSAQENFRKSLGGKNIGLSDVSRFGRTFWSQFSAGAQAQLSPSSSGNVKAILGGLQSQFNPVENLVDLDKSDPFGKGSDTFAAALNNSITGRTLEGIRALLPPDAAEGFRNIILNAVDHYVAYQLQQGIKDLPPSTKSDVHHALLNGTTALQRQAAAAAGLSPSEFNARLFAGNPLYLLKQTEQDVADLEAKVKAERQYGTFSPEGGNALLKGAYGKLIEQYESQRTQALARYEQSGKDSELVAASAAAENINKLRAQIRGLDSDTADWLRSLTDQRRQLSESAINSGSGIQVNNILRSADSIFGGTRLTDQFQKNGQLQQLYASLVPSYKRDYENAQAAYFANPFGEEGMKNFGKAQEAAQKLDQLGIAIKKLPMDTDDALHQLNGQLSSLREQSIRNGTGLGIFTPGLSGSAILNRPSLSTDARYAQLRAELESRKTETVAYFNKVQADYLANPTNTDLQRRFYEVAQALDGLGESARNLPRELLQAKQALSEQWFSVRQQSLEGAGISIFNPSYSASDITNLSTLGTQQRNEQAVELYRRRLSQVSGEYEEARKTYLGDHSEENRKAFEQAAESLDSVTQGLIRARLEADHLAKGWNDFAISARSSLENSLGDAIANLITRTGTLRDVLTAFARDIARAFAQMEANNILFALMGNAGQPNSNGVAQGFGGLLGRLFGGGGTINNAQIAQHFASVPANPGVDASLDSFYAGVEGAANGAVWRGGFRAFATGGIARHATLGVVGEGRYPEAVIPMTNGHSIPLVVRSGMTYARLPGSRYVPASFYAEGGVMGSQFVMAPREYRPTSVQGGGQKIFVVSNPGEAFRHGFRENRDLLIDTVAGDIARKGRIAKVAQKSR